MVPLRLERLEGEVFELPLHLPDAEALCEWGVDLKRLPGDTALLLCRQRCQGAHVVQAITEFDEHHANVLRHGEEHLANVLGVLLLRAHCRELAQLGDAINKDADLIAESLCDLGGGHRRVLGNVVEQRRHEGCRIKAEVGKNQRRLSGVCHIRLTRCAHLCAVRLDGEEEGVVNEARRLRRTDSRSNLVAQRLAERLDRSRKRADLGNWIRRRALSPRRLLDWLRFDAHSFGG